MTWAPDFKYRDNGWDVRNPINYNFLKVPSDVLYYFLGYVAGDGGCWKGGKSFSVSSCTDGYIIDKFRDLIAPENKVTIDNAGYPGYSGERHILCIGRERFWDVISAFDVKAPSIFKRVPGEFIYSFLRGFLDSDGSIRVRDSKSCLGLEVSFSQKSEVYLDALKSLLEFRGLQCSTVGKWKGRELYGFSLATNYSQALCELMYANKGDFYLRRKYECYEKFLASRVDVNNQYVKRSINSYNIVHQKLLAFQEACSV